MERTSVTWAVKLRLILMVLIAAIWWLPATFACSEDETREPEVSSPEAQESRDPSVKLRQLTEASSGVFLAEVLSYDYVPTREFVVFHLAPSKELVGKSSAKPQLWIGGVRGPNGPVLVSDNPVPTPGKKAVIFVRQEPSLGPEAYVPAGDEWSVLQLTEDSGVALPSGTFFPLDEVIKLIATGSAP